MPLESVPFLDHLLHGYLVFFSSSGYSIHEDKAFVYAQNAQFFLQIFYYHLDRVLCYNGCVGVSK